MLYMYKKLMKQTTIVTRNGEKYKIGSEKLVIGVAFYGIKFTFAATNLQENSSASDAGTELQREDSSEMGYHEVIHTIKIY